MDIQKKKNYRIIGLFVIYFLEKNNLTGRWYGELTVKKKIYRCTFVKA